MNESFLRSEMLLGEEAMKQLSMSHVAVFGLGGVGSWCTEALVRSGIGEITIIDEDTVAMSNINRQVEALNSTIGLEKAAALEKRLLDINPRLKVRAICKRYEASSRDIFFDREYDYIADAIDLVSCKLDLIETALSKSIPIISALGTGNKLDPTALEVTDISKTKGCPLARVMRKELRARQINHHKVVYSPELAIKPLCEEEPPPGRRSIPGSIIWVPATAGLIMASVIVRELAE